jgi:hypothetical protein
VGDSSFSAYGEPGRAALHVAAPDVNRTGHDDALAPDPTTPTANTNTNNPPPARIDEPSSGPKYTATAAPAKNQCTCAGCQALARLTGANDTTPAAPTFGALVDLLLTTVRGA